MSWLKKIQAVFNGVANPPARSRVAGFALSIEKKEGVLLTEKSEENSDSPARPFSEDTYFEVTIKSSGSNPEYPRQFDDWKCKFTAAALDRDSGASGIRGDTAYIPSGARWTRFELKEEFYDPRKVVELGGKRLPPHHSVSLKAHYKTCDGKEASIGVGGDWVRQSERNSRPWRDAMNDRTHWL